MERVEKEVGFGLSKSKITTGNVGKRTVWSCFECSRRNDRIRENRAPEENAAAKTAKIGNEVPAEPMGCGFKIGLTVIIMVILAYIMQWATADLFDAHNQYLFECDGLSRSGACMDANEYEDSGQFDLWKDSGAQESVGYKNFIIKSDPDDWYHQ